MSTLALADFFGQYPSFFYNKDQPANIEFGRLCQHMQWCDSDNEPQSEKSTAVRKFQDALVRQFNEVYGTDEHSLEAWQELCRRVGIYPIPETIAEARSKVKETHVNIVDLTESPGGETVTSFDSELELSKYTRRNKRYFPGANAHAGGLLKVLLRRINKPRREMNPAVKSAKRRARRLRQKEAKSKSCE
ncbi:hypothetical protein FA15DRAFT_645014 [Coprinopsis marcescibilis]|uniref:Uncharacterized protein n=1 Tax=Coprinopsis marcescibilis TaxID=230819 RepID=A0A5C3KPS8_COPMA|nr:hypothetical protein FA15DRAFT_645014 [Coprinopsis marcescibilis]